MRPPPALSDDDHEQHLDLEDKRESELIAA
jgi:hypothetical protein